jgi:DNA replication and repair protein RecF
LHLSHLSLNNYRNFVSSEFSFEPEINLILAPNGKGKTNLVEAIYLLGTGVSLKRSKMNILLRHGEHRSHVAAQVCDEVGTSRVEVCIESNRRRVILDGKHVNNLREFLGTLLVVGFSPDSLSAIKGGASVRRSLIDKHIIDLYPSVIDIYSSFNKALSNKRLLLKQEPSVESLMTWNKLLADSIFQILAYRERVIKSLNEMFSVVYSELFGEQVELCLVYRSTVGKVNSSDDVFKCLQQVLPGELRSKRPQVGIHLDEVDILMGGKLLRDYGSQGQVRLTTLALLLATAYNLKSSTDKKPILILDDVDSELDRQRRHSLLHVIAKTGWQAFITSTNFDLPSIFDDSQVNVLLL